MGGFTAGTVQNPVRVGGSLTSRPEIPAKRQQVAYQIPAKDDKYAKGDNSLLKSYIVGQSTGPNIQVFFCTTKGKKNRLGC